jgi:opacity protein-like surface antigen
MNHGQRRRLVTWGGLTGTAILLGIVVLASLPDRAWAAVDCSTVLPTSTADSDGDGLSDYVECHPGLFTFAGTNGVLSFRTCAPNDSDRKTCLDPNTKDGFLVIAPSAVSLLPSITAADVYAAYSPLGLAVHLIGASLIGSDRTVVTGQAAKSVKVTESVDTNGTILGNCNWGTPSGIDGCVVYTQRLLTFINSKCGTTKTTCPTTDTSAACVAHRNYAKRTVFHEGGHSFGGVAPFYDSTAGGYHYPPPNKAANATVMDQYVVANTNCTFNVPKDTSGNWLNNWNTSLDPTGVKLP